ncbi:MAG: hypothetical protein N2110_06140 [Flavobacteriales bacterium]|nr:hypothetical protein [Flavobacteriales bacterium]
MQKTLPLLLSLAAVFQPLDHRAQITITRSNLGDLTNASVVYANDTLPAASLTVGNPGPSQTWDFSSLANHFQDTMIFMPTAGTPCPSEFPTATASIKMNEAQAYLFDDPTVLEILGFCANLLGSGNVVVKTIPPERIFVFPLTYNTSWVDSTRQVILLANPNPGPDSIKIVTITHAVNLVDGWGQVITPIGTYPALRLKKSKHQIDSIFVKLFGSWIFFQPEVTMEDEYSYLTTNGIWAASATTASGSQQPLRASYIIQSSVNISSVPTRQVASFYPNPSSPGPLRFLNPDLAVTQLNLSDGFGRQVLSQKVFGAEIILDGSKLSPGLYLYQGLNVEGRPICSGKLLLK